MDYYKHEIKVVGLTMTDLVEVMDAARAQGYPKVNTHPVAGLGIEMPHSISVYWRVGDEDGIQDMWDLHDAVSELEANLESHLETAFHLGKPERVPASEVPGHGI